MGILKKILTPRYLFAFLVIAGVTMVPVLQSTPDQCVSTTDGDLSEQTTFGQYQGITQSGCGSNLALDYIIGQGTSVSWSGFEGAIKGSVVVNSGATLEITGSANFESSLSNAGSLSVQPQSAPAAPAAPDSEFYNITNISGHTSEGGTTATFKVALDATPKPPAPSAPAKSGSDFYNVTNISGNTAEDGTTATFKVALDRSPAGPVPAAPSVSGSDSYNITNISGNTAEDGTTATFKVALSESCLLYTSPSPRDLSTSRMPSSA